MFINNLSALNLPDFSVLHWTEILYSKLCESVDNGIFSQTDLMMEPECGIRNCKINFASLWFGLVWLILMMTKV